MFFFSASSYGKQKKADYDQLCFNSTVDINYDNLDILVVKPESRKTIVSKRPCRKFVATQPKGP